MLLTSLRGGSDAEEEEVDVSENDEDEDEGEITTKVPAIASMEPVRLIISTNWGNSVIDQTLELTPARTRDVASLKKSLSKQLPGRPPIVALDLVYEGRILDDDTLVDELFEDEDEDEEDEDEEDEDGNESSRKLTLNLVPPVDPKFATELGPKLVHHADDDDDYSGGSSGVGGDADSFTVDELVDAYYMNQVAMSRNAQLLADPNDPSSPFLRIEMKEQAQQLREQLQSETPADVWEKCMAVSDQKGNRSPQEEWRGQRYRSTKGGVSRQLKTIIQTNMNVDWDSAIKNFLMFLFLGYFGGKNSFSRLLLLWGAPLSFALQARPVKIYFKIIFNMMSNLPLIFLSFLPVPQQAILRIDMRASCVALYGEDGANRILGTDGSEGELTATATIFADEEEESDADEIEEDEDEYDSEQETGDEEDYDSDEE